MMIMNNKLVVFLEIKLLNLRILNVVLQGVMIIKFRKNLKKMKIYNNKNRNSKIYLNKKMILNKQKCKMN